MYILVFGFLFSIIFIEHYKLVHKSNYTILYTILFLLMVLHDGLRWEMATDFQSYLTHYKSLSSYKDIEDSKFELLYQLSVYFIKVIFNNYTVYLIFHALIVYSIYFFAIKKYTSYPFIAILFLYVGTIGILGSNRQNIALALCFVSIYPLIRKQYLYFFLIMALAFGFHKTSIIFLPVYFLNRQLNIKVLFGVLVVVFGLSFLSYFQELFSVITIKYLPSLFEEKANFYLSSKDEFSNTITSSIFGVGRKLLPIIILLYYKNRLKNKKFYNVIFNVTFISLIMYIAFNNNLQFLVGRLTSYFSLFECVIFSWFFVALKPGKINFILLVFFLAYAVLLFFRSIAIYPELFIPYKSIFSN